MTGNVREWVFNKVGDTRYLLGGAWNDESYRTTDLSFAKPALDREPGNGLRLALVRDEPDTIAAARATDSVPDSRDITTAAQVSDEVFEAYRINFEYDRARLNADVQTVGSDRLMRHELVEIDAAYGSPRLPIHLYLPTNATPPFHVVLYWPGSIVEELTDYDDFKFQFDFLLKSGRAVAFPVYYNTFGRRDSGAVNMQTSASTLRNTAIRIVKDLRRTVDYLETRPDIDTGKIAFLGQSGGAKYGAITLAMDHRFQAAVLYTLPSRVEAAPDIDAVSYLTRFLTPVLMISGEYDPIVPLPDARTVFELLGTADKDKRLVIAPSGHAVPYRLLVRETLALYDSYLGVPAKQ